MSSPVWLEKVHTFVLDIRVNLDPSLNTCIEGVKTGENTPIRWKNYPFPQFTINLLGVLFFLESLVCFIKVTFVHQGLFDIESLGV